MASQSRARSFRAFGRHGGVRRLPDDKQPKAETEAGERTDAALQGRFGRLFRLKGAN